MIAFIEAQGSLLSMKVRGFKSSRQSFGGRRGIIRVFSQAARRRLMRFLARLKTRKIRATFITLTFTGIVTNDRAKWYSKDLRCVFAGSFRRVRLFGGWNFRKGEQFIFTYSVSIFRFGNRRIYSKHGKNARKRIAVLWIFDWYTGQGR